MTKAYTLTNIKASIIIPVRNESRNILALLTDLQNQSLDKAGFEVIIANDGSTDDSIGKVKSFSAKSSLNLKIISISQTVKSTSPKKKAISESLENAEGEIIITTDGDCRLPEKWLETILQYFQEHEPVFLGSPVFFSDKTSKNLVERLWNSFQQIEFSSLIISGACSMKLKQPNMVSGANMAYLKSAFYAVDGFSGNEHIASGDDEFLLHKMAEKYPNRVHYLKSKEALVYTESSENWPIFFSQRKRWASKWKHYEAVGPKIMALFIFLVNLVTILAFISNDWLALAIKLVPEFIFLCIALSFFNKRNLWPLVPFVQLIYPFYVLLFALVSLPKNAYVWKERKFN